MNRLYLILLLIYSFVNLKPLYAFEQNVSQGKASIKAQVKAGQIVRQSNLFKKAEQRSEVITVLEAKKIFQLIIVVMLGISFLLKKNRQTYLEVLTKKRQN